METLNLSLFKGYSDITPVNVTLDEILRLVRDDGSVAEATRKFRYFRSCGDTSSASRVKSSCPCFAVAVRFAGGKQKSHICGWTGLGLVDIDHVPAGRMGELAAKVKADPHTLLAYVTISGEGLRVIYRVDFSALRNGAEAERFRLYAEGFGMANAHYAGLLGVECDLKCKNATRLSGLAHDESVYFNPDADPFRPADSAEPFRAGRNYRLERGVAAARKELEEAGIVYAPRHHNEYIMRMGYLLNAYGIDREEATGWALSAFTGYDGDVAAVFRSCYADTERFGTRKMRPADSARRRKGRATVGEIEKFLASQGVFRHNVISGKYEMAPAPDCHTFVELDDKLVNSLWARMSKEGHRVRVGDVRGVIESEFSAAFNPFKEYFRSLPPWDGVTDHIARLAATVHTRHGDADCRFYLTKWMVAMVASLLDAKVINHEILALVGSQGTYKTTWLNRLLPEELRPYFCVTMSHAYQTKDDLLRLSEFAVICMEELGEMQGETLRRIKAVTTFPVVNERRAYGHYKENRPHIASLCMTGNNPFFLCDDSSERRWLPMEVLSIDDPHTHPVDYAGVYAQAFALWKGGFRYWLDREEVDELNHRNLYFKAPNLERDLILTHYRLPAEGEKGEFFTVAEMVSRIGVGLRQSLSVSKVGLILRELGFRYVRVNNRRGFLAVPYTVEQMARNRHSSIDNSGD